MTAPKAAGSTTNAVIASQVGVSRVKSTPSGWTRIEPATAPDAAAMVR
jgi:hypothetical protein